MCPIWARNFARNRHAPPASSCGRAALRSRSESNVAGLPGAESASADSLGQRRAHFARWPGRPIRCEAFPARTWHESVMYSTCLFCHSKLGANDVFESFPVGRRLAYDGAKGRLWVVCQGCGRWNLTPLEERWETLEACERLFQGTILRASTANVGLARLAEGTELVRVGRPLRPELAAWRYGSQFGRRYRKSLGLWVGGGLAVLAAGPLGGALSGALAGGALLLTLPHFVHQFRMRYGVVTRVETSSGERAFIRGSHVKDARLLPGARNEANWSLYTPHEGGSITVRDQEAQWLVAQILARINRMGGSARVVDHAVARLEYEGGSEVIFNRIAAKPPHEQSGWARWWYETGGARSDEKPGTLRSFPVADRLALEMASHEEAERRALEGELHALENAWRDAEEIAAIADSLALPASVDGMLARYRKERGSS